MSILNKKKVIFIGNSFIFFGNAVNRINCTEISQTARTGDVGYFYQLCKAGGDEVEITNWTFGGHTLSHIYGDVCGCKSKECFGKNHANELKDRYFDYVVISAGSGEASDKSFPDDIKNLKEIFIKENPNVKFFYLSNLAPFGYSTSRYYQSTILEHLEKIEADGVEVVDWGSLVLGIMTGKVRVPGALLEYNKNTFIISKSEHDGYHQNQLSGYITALMLYCKMTGKTAVGQPYSFWSDASLDCNFDVKEYLRKYYCLEGSKTNYPDVFASEADMLGIQMLIDKALEEKPYKNYGEKL